jgi:AcrR family transcriptional regulator
MLIEAAVEIIRTEGYAALSARRLAEKVGLKRQIVHYYFRTIEELLLSVVRFYGDSGLARMREALRREPLKALWEVQADASATTFAFVAMASHQPAIRAEMRRYMDEFRQVQTDAIAAYFKARGVKPALPPAAIAILIQSVSQTLAVENSIGATRGHAETRTAIDALLRRLISGKKKPASK